MKALLPLLLSFFLYSSLTFGQVADEERAVQQLIQGSFDSIFSAYDAAQLPDFYTDDFLLLEQGEIWTLDTIRGYLARAKANPNPATRTNRFEFIQTVIDGNRAWVAYHNYATITRNGQVVQELYWLESATALKTEKGWRLDMLHSTRVEKK
jgi:ketosteroid isomerase-like protein